MPLPKNYIQFKRYESKAQQGDADAQYILALCHKAGRFVPKNEAMALELYKSVANYHLTDKDSQKTRDSVSEANSELGNHFYKKRNTGRNAAKAFNAYIKAIAVNPQNFIAHLNLALCYEYGIGIQKDFEMAAVRYQSVLKGGSKEQCEKAMRHLHKIQQHLKINTAEVMPDASPTATAAPLPPKEVLSAVFDGEYETVSSYIESGADVNIFDESGKSLILAIYLDHINEISETKNPALRNNILSQLINHPDIDLKNIGDVTPEEISEYFLDNGVVSVTLAPGADARRRYKDSFFLERSSLLHYAALYGDTHTLKLIHKTGKIDVDTLGYIVENRHLLSGDLCADYEIGDKCGKMAAAWLCREAIPITRVGNITALHVAATQGHRGAIYQLLSMGANLNASSTKGNTPSDCLQSTLNDYQNFGSEMEYHGIEFNMFDADTDSEEDSEYEYADDSRFFTTEQESASSEVTMSPKNVLVEFRGLHFYSDQMNKLERREHIKRQHAQSQDLFRAGMHSAASYELANESYKPKITHYAEPLTPAELNELNQDLAKQDKRLLKASIVVKGKLDELSNSGPVKACLGTERSDFESRLFEFVQRYVNSYQALLQDMRIAPGKVLDSRQTEKSRTKWQLLKSLGVTRLPLVSTTDESRWALEYATGLVNYDKSSTFKPRDKSVLPLMPEYSADGRPKHPYLGLVYISLHPHPEVNNTSVHVPTLFSQHKITTRCSSPAGHAYSGYVRARERAFLGYTPREEVRWFSVIRVPNFTKENCPAYFKKKYGIDNSQYTKFKNDLKRFGTIQSSGRMRNEQAFYRTAVYIIQHVINHQQDKLMEISMLAAASSNEKIAYLTPDGTMQDNLPKIEAFIPRQ